LAIDGNRGRRIVTETETAPLFAITAWLVGPARQRCSPEEIVSGLADRLTEAGVPIWRMRIGQRVSNPLISAWGTVWTKGKGAERYSVPRTMLSTTSYIGSPFEHINRFRTPYRHSLERLAEGDHPVLFELAEGGSTDYLALPVEYGDGSVQAGAFTTNRPGGFFDEEIRLIEGLAPAIAAALEPHAMRHSAASLLEVYLGSGPAEQIAKGAFHRGDISEIDAAVLLTDLRDFTGSSERLAPQTLLEGLGAYFEIVVDAVRAEGGDVLKFIGDGVLAVFAAENGREDACRRAARSVSRAFARADGTGTAFVAALHVGPVVYGNVGSLDRLDFTVVGPTVNYASRLETAAKQLQRRAVCSQTVAAALHQDMAVDLGSHVLKGIAEPQRVFELRSERTEPA
jgi:adenylate cyclase